MRYDAGGHVKMIEMTGHVALYGIFGFQKMLGISPLAEEMLASQEGVFSLELVS